MKFKSILVAALAAVVAFSSCSKEESGVQAPGQEGKDAKFSLSFVLPTNMNTRANEDVATTEESDVNYIEVFSYATSGGGYNRYDVSNDFDKEAVSGGMKYTLKSTADLIETVAGNNTIYVGVNSNIGDVSESILLGKIASISDLTDATDGFIMFSDPKTKDLTNTGENGDEVNTVELDIIRIAAKVTVTNNSSDLENDFDTDVTVTYAIQQYGIYQAPVNSYIAPRYNTNNEYVTYSTVEEFNPGNINVDVKTLAGGLSTWACTYTTENNQDVAAYGNSTYAYIRTVATVNRTAKLNSTNDDIEWNSTTADFGGGVADSDIHFFMWNGKTYLANNTEWALISSKLSDITSHYTYYDGYVYFRVYLGTVAAPNQISRNQFMNIAVKKVNANLGEFPGYPGTETDPTKPIDPNENEPVDPNNPDPTDPTDPIDPDKALLEVEVTVKNWTYAEVETELK